VGTHSPFVWLLPLESLPVVASAKHMGHLLTCMLGLERGPHIGSFFVTSWALFPTHETRDHSHSPLF